MKNDISYSFNDLSSDDLNQINNLLKQLSSSAKDISIEWLQEVLRNSFIAVARHNRLVVGMATLTTLRKPTGFFGTCEDVIVDSEYQGMGIGRRLMDMILLKGKEMQMSYIELTSHPSRNKANSLYRSLGFVGRETNIYRYLL